jgi:hypothetical protein
MSGSSATVDGQVYKFAGLNLGRDQSDANAA